MVWDMGDLVTTGAVSVYCSLSWASHSEENASAGSHLSPPASTTALGDITVAILIR